MSIITALAGQAMAADESRLEPTAHPNVKRAYATPQAGVATTATVSSGGLVVYLDEQGRPTQEPSRTRDAVQLPAANQSHEGLSSRPVTLKDGSTANIIDLQGRFQSFAVGTKSADGQVRTCCIGPSDIVPHGKDSATSGCQEKCCK